MIFTTNALLVLFSLLLAGLRIGGVTDQTFQAVAHLWVGGLVGFGSAEHYYTWGSWEHVRRGPMLKIALAVALSVVELVCFLTFPRHT